jgi:polyphosphate kinase 2 (PPK2 family)
MKRIGNAQTISDIEFVIAAPALSDPRQSWTAYGVECTRDRHRYSGPAYEFNIQIVDLRKTKAGRIAWRVLIVTESWNAAGTKGEIHNTKWLKVLNGKAFDVKAWMTSCRSLKVDKGVASQPSEF